MISYIARIKPLGQVSILQVHLPTMFSLPQALVTAAIFLSGVNGVIHHSADQLKTAEYDFVVVGGMSIMQHHSVYAVGLRDRRIF